MILFICLLNWLFFNHITKLSIASNDVFQQFPMFWNFIIGLIALTNDSSLYFLYSFQLLSMVSIFQTMKLVVLAIKVRANQFGATAALMAVVILFFSSLAFYFMRIDYIDNTINDNFCSDYFKCFLNLFGLGIKWGGIYQDPEVIPYANSHFFTKNVFDWFFFFFINFILLNVVNAIIVDTFQTYREEQTQRDYQEKNICYICSLPKPMFEINGYNFEIHIKQEHCLENYIYFLIGIKSEDPHQLNSLQFKILKEMEKIQFFPIKRGMIFDEK